MTDVNNVDRGVIAARFQGAGNSVISMLRLVRN